MLLLFESTNENEGSIYQVDNVYEFVGRIKESTSQIEYH